MKKKIKKEIKGNWGLEDIYRDIILTFCENAAELGCPKDKEVDMWFRYLSPKEQKKVSRKVVEIQDRNRKKA